MSHDFNRDNEVVEARKKFGDWVGFAWLECLSVGDRNDGIVPGTIEQIADRLAPISLQKYHKPSAKTAQMFLKYAADYGWIRIENTHIVILKHAKYHKTRGPKEALSETNEPKQPKQTEQDKNKSPSKEARDLAQTLSDFIFRNIPDRTVPTPAQIMSWAADADKIHRLDKHSWESISSLLAWSQNHDFWKSNILSMNKFRQKWNTLSAQRQRDSNQKMKGPTNGGVKSVPGKYAHLG